MVAGALIGGVIAILSRAPGLQKIYDWALPTGLFTALITFSIIPSQPRYNFEKETEVKLQEAPWIVVVNRTHWGDIFEPRTWLDAPVGSYLVAHPETYGLHEDGNVDLRVTLIQYRKPPQEWLVTTNCPNREALWNNPGADGIFRINPEGYSKLSDAEYEAFCKTDWEPKHRLVMQQAFGKSE